MIIMICLSNYVMDMVVLQIYNESNKTDSQHRKTQMRPSPFESGFRMLN